MLSRRRPNPCGMIEPGHTARGALVPPSPGELTVQERKLPQWLAVLVLLLSVAMMPSDVRAGHNYNAYFGSYARHSQTNALRPHYVAATSTVNWGTSENNASHRDFFRPYWVIVIQDEYHSPTALSSVEVTASSAYVYWFVTPVVNASDTTCLEPSSNPVECTRVRVRHRESAYPGASGAERAQGVCHEMGHAVGFRDWAYGHTGCMGGGTANAGQISSQEINAINYCYANGVC